jgi:hypothetical protein
MEWKARSGGETMPAECCITSWTPDMYWPSDKAVTCFSTLHLSIALLIGLEDVQTWVALMHRCVRTCGIHADAMWSDIHSAYGMGQADCWLNIHSVYEWVRQIANPISSQCVNGSGGLLTKYSFGDAGIQWITYWIFIWCMQGSGRLPIGYSLIGLDRSELNIQSLDWPD